jgi:hypothetical protein
MDNDVLVFAALFIIAVIGVSSGAVMLTFNRISSTSSRARKRRAIHHTAHRAFKDVL